MPKKILLTGATDGIGLLTAQRLVADGHQVLVHGRNPNKLEQVLAKLIAIGEGSVEGYQADFSDLAEVARMASEITAKHDHLDVLINNAGILKTPTPITKDNLDVRFVVNTLAPYLLTKKLMPLMTAQSRVVNLSSAAQEKVNLAALRGDFHLEQDFQAYAQSKLAITMWTRYLAEQGNSDAPIYLAVNPASLLASKMVKEGFGIAGKDMNIGVDILVRAAFDEEFANATGQYFDNDIGQFADPDPAGMITGDIHALVKQIEGILNLD